VSCTAQELRVPGQLGLDARRGQPGELVGEPVRGADGDGGLAHHQALAVEVGGQRLDGGVHVGDVGGVLVALLRRAHADEVHVAEGGGLLVGGGEAQAAGFEAPAQHGFEPGLVDGKLTLVETADLVGVYVEAQDVESEIRHAGRMRDAQVSGPDHRQAIWHE
jgi:hypothetical protein